MNHFCFVGIYAVLAMLMLMIMPSSIADELEIKVEGDKNATVYVKKTDKVSTLKEKIAEKLKKDTNEETNGMHAKVKISNKKMHELKAELEEKHYENTEILPARITLRLDKNDSPLEDSKTMKECGIAPEKSGNAYVYLTLDELEIKLEGDKKAIVYVKKTDKVSTVKQKIVEKLRKEIIEKKAKLEETKNEKNKILTARKTLRLDKNDSPLEDSKTMEEYGIVKKGATVFLALEGFKISIQYRGKKYTIWVNNEDTVYELKEKIEKVIGIHHSEQKLTFQAENDLVLEDNKKTMQFYNIGKGASLLLKRVFRIGCQYKFKEYFPIVEETEKVSSVKEKVKEMINDEILKEKVKEMINDEILKEKVKEMINDEILKEMINDEILKEKVKEMINDEILKEKIKEMINDEILKEKIMEIINDEILKEKIKEMINDEILKEKIKEMINDEILKEKIKEKRVIQLKNITLSYWGKELKDDAEIGSYYRIDSKSAIVGVYELEQSHDDETTTTSPLLND